MKTLLTGASSFTGCWFAKALADAGHDVTATFTRAPEDYTGLRGDRLAHVAQHATVVHGTRFGDDAFLDLAKRGGFGLLCHHAADVTDYKSADFDVARALSTNTHQLKPVLEAMNCPVLLTGSVFEGCEGAGSDGLPHFSPYGLSKSLTAQTVRYQAEALGLPMGKFVIPNPFGPFEEPRFTNYLAKNWRSGNTPGCNTPAYVRDNIHVDLLARAYADFAEKITQPYQQLNPSGYIESQGGFALRFAAEMSKRWGIDCPVDLADQTAFDEPRIRINTDVPEAKALGFDEGKAWDAFADYYERMYAAAQV